MSGEGIVKIGATFDKSNVDAGLGETQEMVKASMASITTSIVEAGAKSKAAWKGLSDGVKTNAESLSAEWRRVAETSRAAAASQLDVRRAITLTKDAAIPAAASLAALGAAQQKFAADQAAAAAAVAAAKQAEAETIAAANEEAALSESILVATFERAGLAVRESLTAVQEKLVETAGTAKLSADGIAGGFAGLSSLLGAGIAAGFAASYIDGLAKMNVELSHLHVETGLSITNLAGLQQIAREMGSDWDPIATGLTRMNKNLNDAVPPTKQLQEALGGVNLTFKELQGLTAEEKLGKIATAFAATRNEANRTAAAYALFGRGGVALIPILTEQGAQLEANMKKTGELTGVTDESAAAARRWTKDVADLTSEFRGVMMPVMEHAGDVISGVAGTFEAAAFVIVAAFESIATAIVSTYAPLVHLGTLAKDVFTGNWAAIKGDVQAGVNSFTDTWKTGFADIRSEWDEVAKRFKAPPGLPPMPEGAGAEALADAAEGRTGGRRSAAGAKAGSRAAAVLAEAQAAPRLHAEIGGAAANSGAAGGQLFAQGVKADLEQAIAAARAKVKVNEDASKQMVEADRAAAEEKMQIAAEDYRDVETNSAFEVQMGRMTAQQRVEALRQAANREQQIREQQSRFIQMLDMGDSRRYMQDLKQQEMATRQWARVITQLNQRTALDFQKSWLQGIERMTTEFAAAVGRWTVDGQGFEQSMARVMGGIQQNFVQNMVKMMGQEVLAAIQHKGLMSQQIIADAKGAAANSFNWASSWGGPIAGAIAAAAAFAGVMAFDSFAAGGMVRGGGGMAVPILAHAGERVLSQSQTENFHKLVNQNTSSSSSSNTTHLHLEQNVNAYDRSGMRSTLRAHADDLLDIVQQGINSGRLRSA